MNKTLTLLSLVLALQACGGDSIEFLRSSNHIDTSDMYVHVAADIRQRANENDTALEDYTKLYVHFAGRHSDGYYYSIELGEDDQLNATVAGQTRPVPADMFPPEGDTLSVAYIDEYEQTGAGTEFTVNLDRARDAELHSMQLALPQETPFTVSGSDLGVGVNDTLVVEWQEADGWNYDLRFQYDCLCDGERRSFHLHYPNSLEPEITSPFSIVPADHLGPAENLSECSVSTAITASQEQQVDSAFARQIQGVSRRQTIVRMLNLD